MLTAAVVSRRFRNLLLTDPQAALHAGYNDESFSLSESERDAVLAIQAANLRDFATQLVIEMDDDAKADPGSDTPHRARQTEAAPGVAHYV
ncbi:MAG: hypothetical protein DCC55_13820 [Chloroflexi bacterium]|nr:MAG: hypothetical protein DCC55_13820 [Chloroflexota bacterium]